jgi:uncharacterized protein (DUF2237 family)
VKMKKRPDRPRLEDMPHVVGLPIVAEFLGVPESTCRARIRGVGDDYELRVLDRVLPVFKEGRRWCAWRWQLAEMVGEKV